MGGVCFMFLKLLFFFLFLWGDLGMLMVIHIHSFLKRNEKKAKRVQKMYPCFFFLTCLAKSKKEK